jgi:hypothetical protein
MDERPLGLIGGHQGMAVERHWDGLRYTIRKAPLHEKDTQHADRAGEDLFDLNLAALHNEAAMLDAMADSGYTPDLTDIDEGVLWQTDVGVMESPRDMEAWRRNCVRMLATIRSRGLRHGDLRGTNVITRDDWPWVIDWQDANIIGDVLLQRQPWSDSHLLMQHIEGTLGPDGFCDTPRVARRWRAVLWALGAAGNCTLPLRGKTFLDLGCFQGDFVALAAAEGMNAVGIDRGGFRTGEDSIAIGQMAWADFPFGQITLANLDIDECSYESDVAVMFSTWSYVVKDHGLARAEEVLAKVIAEAGVLFFENQLYGDGPGPEFLKTDEDIRTMLHRLGGSTVKALATFPVTGRPGSRTVWEVQR